MTTKKQPCPHCGHPGPHKFHERDGDGTDWWLCKNPDCPIGHFGRMSPTFKRVLRQDVRIRY